MNTKAHLLYVEDDESLSFVTQENLERQGYAITHCHDGKEALQAIREEDFDLCILDVMLPEVDGFTIAEEVRKHDADVPILFLTAKSLKEDRLHGLRLGADDYITKPFSIEELILKIEVFLRRSKVVQPLKTSQIRLGKFSFDYENLTLHHGEQHKRLTQREADLLWFLAQSRNQVVKRSEILKAIWGDDDYFLGRSLDVFISRLRKYLSSDDNVRIENIHGVGFCFQIKESA
jgi:DNA-binding response OmpR family regulator